MIRSMKLLPANVLCTAKRIYILTHSSCTSLTIKLTKQVCNIYHSFDLFLLSINCAQYLKIICYCD